MNEWISDACHDDKRGTDFFVSSVEITLENGILKLENNPSVIYFKGFFLFLYSEYFCWFIIREVIYCAIFKAHFPK